MSKELEALNKIQHDFGQLKGQELVNCYEIIFKALKRLESIDNAKPNEELEILYNNAKLDRDRIEEGGIVTYAEEIEHNEAIKPYYDTIKQALQRLNKYEEILSKGRLTDRNYKNTTLDIDSCKPYLRLGELEDIYEESKYNE